ncbi:MAG: SpoIID/LytB domain-containing protein [Negativicutes bacterium]|nr:SpoIID/LytB domain-containing protein [Negativicutes bacterium]
MKRVLWLFLLLSSLTFAGSCLAAETQPAVPAMIAVGLDYGDEALAEVRLGFQSGIRLSCNGLGIWHSTELRCLLLSPENGNYSQLTVSFADYADAAAYLVEYGYNKDAAPAYTQEGWKIWLATAYCETLAVPATKAVVNGSCIRVRDVGGLTLFFYQPTAGDSLDTLRSHMAVWQDYAGGDLIYGPNQRCYPAEMLIQRYHNFGLTVINNLPFEEYIAAVISREMSPSWPLEALKAQAVASRSFILSTQFGTARYLQYGFDINTDQQTYIGIDYARTPVVQQAVQETAAEVIWYPDGSGNQKMAAAYYHADAGGSTENCENVFIQAVPYIRGVQEFFKTESPDNVWLPVPSLSAAEIRQNLLVGYGDIGEIRSMRVSKAGAFGAAIEIEIEGSLRTIVLKKGEGRYYFGLKSYNFTVTKQLDLGILSAEGRLTEFAGGRTQVITADGNRNLSVSDATAVMTGQGLRQLEGNPAVYSFPGGGSGHNLGMSQYGAQAMAKLGYNYREILQFYYTGVTVGK